MTISEQLKKMFDEDQAERTVGHDNIDFEKMRANDTVRLVCAKEIYELIKGGKVSLAGADLYHLAMLFQHSPATEHYRIAQEVAEMAVAGGSKEAGWLSAAAEDRYLLAIGKKQKWGTQFKNEAGTWEQSPMQSDDKSGITDEQRNEKGVPARADQMSTFLARKDI